MNEELKKELEKMIQQNPLTVLNSDVAKSAQEYWAGANDAKIEILRRMCEKSIKDSAYPEVTSITVDDIDTIFGWGLDTRRREEE